MTSSLLTCFDPHTKISQSARISSGSIWVGWRIWMKIAIPTCGYTPQQNGVAERKNRHLPEVHLPEVAQTLMMHMHVSKEFWGGCCTYYMLSY